MTKRELDFIEITKKLMDAMGVREKDVRSYFSGEETRLEDRVARQYLSHNLIRFKKDLDNFLRFKKTVLKKEWSLWGYRDVYKTH